MSVIIFKFILYILLSVIVIAIAETGYDYEYGKYNGFYKTFLYNLITAIYVVVATVSPYYYFLYNTKQDKYLYPILLFLFFGILVTVIQPLKAWIAGEYSSFTDAFMNYWSDYKVVLVLQGVIFIISWVMYYFKNKRIHPMNQKQKQKHTTIDDVSSEKQKEAEEAYIAAFDEEYSKHPKNAEYHALIAARNAAESIDSRFEQREWYGKI